MISMKSFELDNGKGQSEKCDMSMDMINKQITKPFPKQTMQHHINQYKITRSITENISHNSIMLKVRFVNIILSIIESMCRSVFVWYW